MKVLSPNFGAVAQLQAELHLLKVEKLDACIRPLFTNPVTESHISLPACMDSVFPYSCMFAILSYIYIFVGTNARIYVHTRLLFEANKNGETYCYKKPKLVSSGCKIFEIMARYPLPLDLSPFVIIYTFKQQQKVFEYKKVKHNLLNYLEAEKCLYPLLKQLYSVCDKLSNINLFHTDVRLPNICFNERYNIVLIDFDQAVDESQLTDELSIFASDLIRNSRSWIKSDQFLVKLSKGEWCEHLLEHIRAHCSTTIEEVIKARDNDL